MFELSRTHQKCPYFSDKEEVPGSSLGRPTLKKPNIRRQNKRNIKDPGEYLGPYGNPRSVQMGGLGEFADPETMMKQLIQQTLAYSARGGLSLFTKLRLLGLLGNCQESTEEATRSIDGHNFSM